MINIAPRLFWAVCILLALLIYIINSRGLMSKGKVR